LLLGDSLRLMQSFSFEVNVSMFPSNGFDINGIDNCAVENKIRDRRHGHHSAEAV